MPVKEEIHNIWENKLDTTLDPAGHAKYITAKKHQQAKNKAGRHTACGVGPLSLLD